MSSICVVGHVTRDLIRRPAMPDCELPGGAAYYTGIALGRLGVDAEVVTRAPTSQRAAIEQQLRAAGALVRWGESAASTFFELSYTPPPAARRTVRLLASAAPFELSDLHAVQASIIHLGPLTRLEMEAAFLHAAADHSDCLSVDVQGMVRVAGEEGSIRLEDWPQKEAGLAAVDVLKAAREEAEILTGEKDVGRAARMLAAWGPREVIVTLADRGSLIWAGGREHRIPAYAPSVLVDATGCGDTYMAGYLSQRLRSDDVEAAGRFGAATATLKLERSGPFARCAADVRACMRAAPELAG